MLLQLHNRSSDIHAPVNDILLLEEGDIVNCIDIKIYTSCLSQSEGYNLLMYSINVDISSIDLFDLNVGIVCANVTLIFSWISLVLIYLINLWVWYVPKLDSDAHGYHWY